ncbi:MAG: YqiA/YcfP family alpha/beta fold hydrolase [Methylobacter sp.]|nr:YqiA/YcfP family alpha/beta fold hydrolase [Methylobacter sp.]
MKKLVIYNHGKDSIPWGEKTIQFAEVAKRYDYLFESPDYQEHPDHDKRVEQLLAMDLSGYDEVVLIGSSMGAYVSTVASESIKPKGLFLLAPAFYLPGYRQTEFNPTAEDIRVFHGWQDDIVPPENAWRFCRKYRVCLNLYDTDHRMLSVLPQLVDEFSRFLTRLSG